MKQSSTIISVIVAVVGLPLLKEGTVFQKNLWRQRIDGRICQRKKDKSLGIKFVKVLTP
jgi:hypothetical protein